MIEISSYSDKALTIVTGTLVVVTRPSGVVDPKLASAFEAAVDRQRSLRRRGPVAVQCEGDLVTLGCEVEYGPVFGGWSSDLQRVFQRLWDECGHGTDGFVRKEVVNVCRRALRTRAEVDETIAALEVYRASNESPDAGRLGAWHTLARLRSVLG